MSQRHSITNARILEVLREQHSVQLDAVNETNRQLDRLNGRVSVTEKTLDQHTIILNENCRKIAEHDTGLAVLGVQQGHVTDEAKLTARRVWDIGLKVATATANIGIILYLVYQVLSGL